LKHAAGVAVAGYPLPPHYCEFHFVMSEIPSFSSLARSGVLCGLMLSASLTANAGVFDFLFGKTPAQAETGEVDPKQRVWQLEKFTKIELVRSEQGASPNQHPAQWSAEALRQQLATVQTAFRGSPEPLFGADELLALSGPLSQALALAKPGDDVLLLSTHRRANGIAMAPFGITARLFVKDGSLQMIVHDSRLDFMDTYFGTRVLPSFTFGSRDKPGSAALKSAAATSLRADWLSFAPASPASVGASASSPPGGASPAPVAAQPVAAEAKSSVASPLPVAPAPQAAPAARPRSAASADEIEQRLTTLKRLRDKQLISEEEYQQKRKEVLQLL
jgi:hypothetical protein